MRYVGTFISGFEKNIPDLLSQKINDVKITDVYNGLIFFETNNIIDINSIFFLNNIYLLINKINILSANLNKNIGSVINTNIDYKIIKSLIKNNKNNTFKVKVFVENQPTRFDYNVVKKLEGDIKSNLKLQISNRPAIEFVIQERSEGFVLFMVKISSDRITEKNLQKGSLRPELAYLLVSLAKLNKNDVVLDPFLGYGSIPKTIVKHFEYNMCFASDINHNLVTKMKKEYKNNNKRIFIKEKDARNLDNFEPEFIDAIITDPPWNIYNKNENINFSQFYKEMLIEFCRILKNNGRIIILIGNQENFENALGSLKELLVSSKISILVNGKKANVYTIKKQRRC